MENGRKNNAIFWELSQLISMSKNRNDIMFLFGIHQVKKKVVPVMQVYWKLEESIMNCSAICVVGHELSWM